MSWSVSPATPIRASQLSDIEFCAWIGQAEAGERLRYHEGFLGIDAMSGMSKLPEAERTRLCGLAQAALSAFELGLIHLVQARVDIDRFAYLAIARARPRNSARLMARLLNDLGHPAGAGDPAHRVAA